jgi:L-2,4-diaminobutyrate decarboxylase
MTADPFDPELFRARGHAIVDRLADHLVAASRGPEGSPVLPWVPPAEMAKRWPATFDAPTDPLALVDAVVRGSNHLHDPRYVGHQVTSPLPTAALFELVATLLNNGSAVYEMGPVSIGMERSVLGFLAQKLGFGAGADGVLTSGGSAGNLTALLAMRQAMAGYDAWGQGSAGGPPLAILASDQTHYCVKRSAQILGLGDDGVASVPTDDAFRLRPDLLEGALAEATARGRKVIGVVGSACSTATGAIDPLDEIADFAERHGLWFHVDGAHGASLVLSTSLAPRLRGIERASSVVWDAHKMMLTPALLTAVVFREGRRSYESFAQEASYLFAGQAAADHERNWWDVGQRTLECTKRMMGFVLYATLATHGAAAIGAYVEGRVALTARFADMLTEAGDFEIATPPDANILCFRFTGGGLADSELDDAQARVRQRILERGAFYLVQTRLRGGLWLRVTLINPRTDESHLVALMDEIRRVAAA